MFHTDYTIFKYYYLHKNKHVLKKKNSLCVFAIITMLVTQPNLKYEILKKIQHGPNYLVYSINNFTEYWRYHRGK